MAAKHKNPLRCPRSESEGTPKILRTYISNARAPKCDGPHLKNVQFSLERLLRTAAHKLFVAMTGRCPTIMFVTRGNHRLFQRGGFEPFPFQAARNECATLFTSTVFAGLQTIDI